MGLERAVGEKNCSMRKTLGSGGLEKKSIFPSQTLNFSAQPIQLPQTIYNQQHKINNSFLRFLTIKIKHFKAICIEMYPYIHTRRVGLLIRKAL